MPAVGTHREQRFLLLRAADHHGFSGAAGTSGSRLAGSQVEPPQFNFVEHCRAESQLFREPRLAATGVWDGAAFGPGVPVSDSVVGHIPNARPALGDFGADFAHGQNADGLVDVPKSCVAAFWAGPGSHGVGVGLDVGARGTNAPYLHVAVFGVSTGP